MKRCISSGFGSINDAVVICAALVVYIPPKQIQQTPRSNYPRSGLFVLVSARSMAKGVHLFFSSKLHRAVQGSRLFQGGSDHLDLHKAVDEGDSLDNRLLM